MRTLKLQALIAGRVPSALTTQLQHYASAQAPAALLLHGMLRPDAAQESTPTSAPSNPPSSQFPALTAPQGLPPSAWRSAGSASASSRAPMPGLRPALSPAASVLGWDLPFALRFVYPSTSSAAPMEASQSTRPTATAAGKDHGSVKEAEEQCGRSVEASSPGDKEPPREEQTYWSISPKKVYREDGTPWTWHCFTPADSYRSDTKVDLAKHFKPTDFGDIFAKYLVKSLRIPTDIFFQRRYGCRAVMLETVAAVPGMVAGMLLHLRSLRLIEHSGGWIKALLEEAENERMHLMTFMEVSQPKWYERALIFSVQGVFFSLYTLTYILSPRIAHRIVGYLEEEAVHSYTDFLKDIDSGKIENVPAPAIAIDYWRLPKDARLRDVVLVVRADEAHHRDVNHFAANIVREKKKLKDHPAPVGYH